MEFDTFESPVEDHQLALLVPRRHVKKVKTALEEANMLDKNSKIEPLEQRPETDIMMKIWTRMEIHRHMLATLDGSGDYHEEEETKEILDNLYLKDLLGEVKVVIEHRPAAIEFPDHWKPLQRTLAEGLLELPEGLLDSLETDLKVLVDEFPTTYSIYKPMLLLPPNTMSGPAWKSLLEKYKMSSPILTPIWSKIAASVGCTHIAINSSIPPSTNSNSSPSEQKAEAENILRSPINLTSVHGDFGPPPTPERQQHPTREDFDKAFWVSTTQNGIHQTWAPLYTMFSRGNIREKTRILELPSVQTAISEGRGKPTLSPPTDIGTPTLATKEAKATVPSSSPPHPKVTKPHASPPPGKLKISAKKEAEPQRPFADEGKMDKFYWSEKMSVGVQLRDTAGNFNLEQYRADREREASGRVCTAADLYAGIGYFAFSYKKAGVNKVLCWELNPWSVEGLRRGARLNGWSSRIYNNTPASLPSSPEAWTSQIDGIDFVIFQDSNERALAPISQLAFDEPKIIPPIRHVNCGFLPSSCLSWQTAVRSLDADLGGWIHAHENVGVDDIETRKKEVVAEMQKHIDEWEAEKGCCGGYRKWVKCEHVERVKTYAPGVVHVVFDVWVDGRRDAEEL
jgi:tRNA wybutosine-synthesizing protein 2